MPSSKSAKVSSKAAAPVVDVLGLGDLTSKWNLLTLKDSNKPLITATSQVSRFHVDTLTTLATEIDLKQVNITVGQKDILVDAHLKLKAGIHYALVGRNGEGKSTILSAIADRIIPGIPENLRILLVSQVEDNDPNPLLAGEDDEVKADLELTVVERVVKSDKRRERALAEQRVLLKAHESNKSTAIAETVFAIRLVRAKEELVEAKKTALKRSGTRGADARKALLKAEALVSDLEERIAKADWGDDETQLALDATDLLTDVQARLDSLDANTTEARARSILLGLGFKQEKLDVKFKTLSGGWRSRCSLANALLLQPDILMLDEPTNYLDIMSVIWLQTYLESIDKTVLAVAHDREFIDAITNETIILRQKTLTYFDGNLSEAERFAKNDRKNKMKLQGALDKKKSAIEKSIEAGARMAKKTGDENRQRMIKSRQKKLDDRWGLEQSAKGTRFKLNRDLAGFHLTSRVAIDIDAPDRQIKLSIPSPPGLRFPGALIAASNLTFSYPAAPAPTLQEVSFTLHPGQRAGIVGQNGEGKSTLIKLLLGKLKAQKGLVERHPRMRVGYFDQHTVEALSVPALAKVTAVEHFITALRKPSESGVPETDVDEQEARSFLGSYGLGQQAVQPISTLSGGQKVRLAMALTVYPTPDLLVLDEATTHLDQDTIKALVKALRAYEGGLIVVSHDRHFVKCVVEGAPLLPPEKDGERDDDDDEQSEESEDEGGEGGGSGGKKVGKVYSVGPKGKLKELTGGVDDYVRLVEKRMKGLTPKG